MAILAYDADPVEDETKRNQNCTSGILNLSQILSSRLSNGILLPRSDLVTPAHQTHIEKKKLLNILVREILTQNTGWSKSRAGV